MCDVKVREKEGTRHTHIHAIPCAVFRYITKLLKTARCHVAPKEMEDHADGLPKTLLAKEARERERGSISEGRSLLDDDDDDDDGDWTVQADASQWKNAVQKASPGGLLSSLLPALFGIVPLLVLLTLASPLGSNLPLLNRHSLPYAAGPPMPHAPPPPPGPNGEAAAAAVTTDAATASAPSSATISKAARRAKRRQRKWSKPAAPPNLVHTHVVPQGGALSVECQGGTVVRKVTFASFGTPTIGENGSIAINPKCHSHKSMAVIRRACVGQSHCCLPIGTDNFKDDPCRGTVKTLAVTLEGCDEYQPMTTYKRHCSLLGQPLLCDEDIEFLAGLSLPPAPQPIKQHVALMVDTSWRPHLQHYVVHNVRNHTGWHIQLFHGPTNGPKLKGLFADVPTDAITFTNLGSDYMEDWQRLSSMMLIDNFWESVVGNKALVFQPDSIMCSQSTYKMEDFTQYDYVGAPMAGPWWMTSDDDSQWSVGCGGFSLRDRTKSILMTREPRCITPGAGKLEDQQLGTMWKYLKKRCDQAGIQVNKPTRFGAIRFAVEYDLHMDVLPGDDPKVLGKVEPAYAKVLPGGCKANYYVGPRYDPGAERAGKPPKWNPKPKPDERVRCELPHFVPIGCHKCWRWNYKTWRHMVQHCPEAKEMRRLRALYKVGIEFTGWPTRPGVTPIKGPAKPDPRYLPIDMKEGKCKGRCVAVAKGKFESTKKGMYHK